MYNFPLGKIWMRLWKRAIFSNNRATRADTFFITQTFSYVKKTGKCVFYPFKKKIVCFNVFSADTGLVWWVRTEIILFQMEHKDEIYKDVCPLYTCDTEHVSQDFRFTSWRHLNAYCDVTVYTPLAISQISAS